MSFQAYWKAAREPRYSITFALPLLLLYEVLSALLSGSDVSGVRNGADVLLKTLFIVFGGRDGLIAFGVLLCAAAAWLVWRDVKRHPGPLKSGVLAGMLLESVGYAAMFGFVVSGLTAMLLRVPLMTITGPPATLSLGTHLVVSLGAGIYEELLFRVLLVSGFAALGIAIGWSRPIAVWAAVVASAVVFSSFHYVGPFGDVLTLSSFTFRFIAGMMLSGLYVARGYGITAWTHALYDVALALLVGS
jgi:hypothetical protein